MVQRKLDTPFEELKRDVVWTRLVSRRQYLDSDTASPDGVVPSESSGEEGEGDILSDGDSEQDESATPLESDSEEGENEWYTADERTISSLSTT